LFSRKEFEGHVFKEGRQEGRKRGRNEGGGGGREEGMKGGGPGFA
jgi:hypothetical protein